MRTSWVKTKSEWVKVDDVEFVDIAEGLHGDEMTFRYQGEEYRSVVVLASSSPG
jgi:hypothetical protein